MRVMNKCRTRIKNYIGYRGQETALDSALEASWEARTPEAQARAQALANARHQVLRGLRTSSVRFGMCTILFQVQNYC